MRELFTSNKSVALRLFLIRTAPLHETVETVSAFCAGLINPRLKSLCEKPSRHAELVSASLEVCRVRLYGFRNQFGMTIFTQPRKSGVNEKKSSRFNRFSASPNAALRVMGLIILVFFIGCNDMYDSGRIKPLEKSPFFSDGSSARQFPEGTVARGYEVNDDLLSTGKLDGKLADKFPFAITDSIMRRGKDRYTTFCTPCHGRLGDGGGMIVQRGFPRPNSFHSDSVRAKPAGHYFDVMTNGFGKMYSYAPSIPVQDRWAIVAYIRALQLSEHASAIGLPDSDKKKISALSQ